MKTLPSKELLSAVLGREVKGRKGRISINDNTITFAYEDEDMWSDMNIYELMHLMKEWALSRGIVLESTITKTSGLCHTGSKTHNNTIYHAWFIIW